MGTGKTAISNYLHYNNNMEIVDMDSQIAELEGMSISDIFAKHGEEYFRNAETDFLKNLKDRTNTVVSCGGGTPLREENVKAMRDNGTIVLLSASPETIFERVKNSHDRPILENNMNVGFIEELLSKRIDKYMAAADIIIETDGKTKKEISQELLDKIN